MEQSKFHYEDFRVGILKDSSLMGVFPLPIPNPPPQVSSNNMISSMKRQSHDSDYPWVEPSSSQIASNGDVLPLIPIEVAYQVIQSISKNLDPDEQTTSWNWVCIFYHPSLSILCLVWITFSILFYWMSPSWSSWT